MKPAPPVTRSRTGAMLLGGHLRPLRRSSQVHDVTGRDGARVRRGRDNEVTGRVHVGGDALHDVVVELHRDEPTERDEVGAVRTDEHVAATSGVELDTAGPERVEV